MIKFITRSGQDIFINEELIESITHGGFYSGEPISEIKLTNKTVYFVRGFIDDICNKINIQKHNLSSSCQGGENA